MAIKPETRFTSLVVSKLDPAIDVEKMNNPFKKGIVDLYIEGSKDIIWCEVKWVDKPWMADREPSKICSTVSWIKQRHFLEARYVNDKQTCVLVGIGKGKDAKGYILEYPYNFQVEKHAAMSLEEIAEYFKQRVL